MRWAAAPVLSVPEGSSSTRRETSRSMLEASDKNINAFCLTVDKNGHDYLKTMCADMGYEILDDIYALPQRLLYLYRRLTI